MTEIKFRCWSKKEGMSYTPISINFNTDGHINGNAVFGTFPVKIVGDNDLVWMQFTGLRDKNGKEIYESDHVKYEMGDWEMTVNWVGAGFWLVNPSRKDIELTPNVAQDLIVIGNKYEAR